MKRFRWMCGTEGNCKVDKFQYVEQLENFQFVGASPCRQTRKLALTRCRGVRRMHLRTNAPACVRAPGSHLRLICAWLIARAKFLAICSRMIYTKYKAYFLLRKTIWFFEI